MFNDFTLCYHFCIYKTFQLHLFFLDFIYVVFNLSHYTRVRQFHQIFLYQHLYDIMAIYFWRFTAFLLLETSINALEQCELSFGISVLSSMKYGSYFGKNTAFIF